MFMRFDCFFFLNNSFDHTVGRSPIGWLAADLPENIFSGDPFGRYSALSFMIT